MIDDLPELGNIFEEAKINLEESLTEHDNVVHNDIYIYISKGNGKWVSVTFLDVAPSNIGLHVMLPIEMEFTAEELDNVKIKFEKKLHNKKIIIKEAPILIRWKEREPISGKIKVGIHFPGEVKSEPEILEVLEKLKKQKT